MKKLCVIFGGSSAEHDISIITGMQLIKNIEKKYPVEKIYLGLDNKFYLANKINEVCEFFDKKNLKLQEIMFFDSKIYRKGIIFKKITEVDCVVNCCHGGVGEDGDLAGFFNLLGIKYTSANSLASHIAMDKSLAKSMVRDVVPVVDGVKIDKYSYDYLDELVYGLNEDVIVKPNSLGSSIGVKACKKYECDEQIQAIFEMNDDALIENRVKNIIEYNQACIKTKDGILLSAIERPIANDEILSFDDKYKSKDKSKGNSRIIPADIDDELKELIDTYTKAIYEKLNMNGVARIDYIFDVDSGELYFNEINTIPGSMAFYLFEPVGVDYISLIDLMIENATSIKKYTYFNTDILKDKKI